VNEGFSVYAQSEMLPDEVAALRTAVQRNRLLPITSLAASARGAADAVSLFYAQSGSIVAFMINTYGPDKFGSFVAALAQDTTDAAMQKVYGFDQLGLENEWRKAIGVAGVPGGTSPTAVPQSSNQQQPTPRPNNNQSQNQQPTPRPNNNQQQASNSDDGGGVSLILVAGVLGVVVVVLLGAAGGLIYQGRRRAQGP
jgi:hypothetical protein